MLIGFKNIDDLRALLQNKIDGGAHVALANKTGTINFNELLFFSTPEEAFASKAQDQQVYIIEELIKTVDHLTKNHEGYSFFAEDVGDTMINLGLYHNTIDCAIHLNTILTEYASRNVTGPFREFLDLAVQEFVNELCKSQAGADLATEIWNRHQPTNIQKPGILTLSQKSRVRVCDNKEQSRANKR